MTTSTKQRQEARRALARELARVKETADFILQTEGYGETYAALRAEEKFLARSLASKTFSVGVAR